MNFISNIQKDYNEKEKEIIINYIKKMKRNIKHSVINNHFKNFLISLQILIYYLTQKIIINEDEIIDVVIKSSKIYFKFSDDFKDFLSNEGKKLTIDKLMNIYNIFEHLCYNELVCNLQIEFQNELFFKQQQNITNKLINDENNNFNLYTIKDLATSVRRFISRYLVGKMQTTDIKIDRELAFELSRGDLWDEKIRKIENLNKIIENQISEFKLTVDQAYEFYELIGKEDKKYIEIFN